MRPFPRFANSISGGVLAAALVLAACGDPAAEAPSAPAGGELVPALDGIADPEVIAAIVDLFPAPLQVAALTRYASIRIHAVGNRPIAAITEAFEFLQWTLGQLERDRLNGPDPAEGVAELFALIFEELGIDGPPLSGANLEDDFAFALLGPEGGRVTVPSHHAAIAFDPGVLTGPTWVVVAGLPEPDEPGMCPSGFPMTHDCYPLFYDYSVFPERHLAGVPRIGQCVLDDGPLAPPSEEVEMRLRIASESEDEPGTLVFWPLTEAPSTVDCSDLELGEIAAWQGALFDALGPLANVFRVTPAQANPGKLGASVSSFSPFAPVDPLTGETEPEPEVEGTIEGVVLGSQQQPVSGQLVQLRRVGGGFSDSAVTDEAGEFAFEGLPIDPEGTAYRVGTANRFGSDTEKVTLTEEDPDAFVTLMLPTGEFEEF